MTNEAAPSLPPEIRKLSFLVAEQNPALQKSIVTALQAAGATRILTAAAGNAAWSIWKNGKQVDVFVCASNLPEMPGADMASRLRADKDLQVQPGFILLSSEASDQAAKDAIDKGVDVVLRKPFPADQIIPKIIETIGIRKQAGGKDLSQRSLEQELLHARLPVELVFDRYTNQVECEEVSLQKCIIRVTNNYGLGTVLNLRFPRPSGGEEQYFRPVKGIVMKTERVPREIGVYRLHIQFNAPIKEQQGVQELLRASMMAKPSG